MFIHYKYTTSKPNIYTRGNHVTFVMVNYRTYIVFGGVAHRKKEFFNKISLRQNDVLCHFAPCTREQFSRSTNTNWIVIGAVRFSNTLQKEMKQVNFLTHYKVKVVKHLSFFNFPCWNTNRIKRQLFVDSIGMNLHCNVRL